MGVMMKKILFIVNPASNGGKMAMLWPHLYNTFLKHGLKFSFQITEYPNHARELAKKAVENFYDIVVAVGGDGTIHETVNGLMAGKKTSGYPTVFAALSGGTGCDLARSLPLPKTAEELLFLLNQAAPSDMDLFLVKYQSLSGQWSEVFAVNIADIGLGAEIAQAVNQMNGTMQKNKSRRFKFFHQLLKRVFSCEDIELSISTEKGPFYTGKTKLIVAANGQYFGGGVKISPNACLNDGYLNLLTTRPLKKWELCSQLPSIYVGKHIHHPKVLVTAAKEAQISLREPKRMEVDGEILGFVQSATLTVMPAALSVLHSSKC